MASINTEVYVGYVDVDVDLEDFETEDLLDELDRRGQSVANSEYVTDLIKTIYEKRRNGLDFSYELDTMIHETIGRVS